MKNSVLLVINEVIGNFFENYQFEDALQSLENNETEIGIKTKLYRAWIYNFMGNYEPALEELDSLKEDRNDDFEIFLGSLVIKSYIYFNIGNTLSLTNYLIAISKLIEQIKKPYPENISYWIATYYHICGLYNYNSGAITIALDCFNKALELRCDLKDNWGKGISSIGIGCCYSYLGEFSNAIDYYENARSIFEQTDNKILLKYICCQVCNSYRYLGKIKESLNLASENLEFFQNFSNHPFYGDALHEMGATLLQLDKKSEAKTYFKMAIKEKEKLNNNFEIIVTLFEYIQLLIKENDLKEIKKIEVKINKILNSNPDNFTIVISKLILALIKKSDQRLLNKIKAMIIFEDLIQNSIINKNIKLKFITLKNLIDLYFIEYQLDKNEDSEKRIEIGLNKIELILRQSQSSLINVYYNLLESKYNILKGNLIKGLKYLEIAQDLIDINGLNYAKYEIYEILDIIKKINESTSKLTSEDKKSEKCRILEYLNEVSKSLSNYYKR